jgi:hypothetical protein
MSLQYFMKGLIGRQPASSFSTSMIENYTISDQSDTLMTTSVRPVDLVSLCMPRPPDGLPLAGYFNWITLYV